MRKTLFALMALTLLGSIQAQTDSSKKRTLIKWIQPEIGAIVGAQEPSEDYRITAGVQKGNWNLGIGAAFDKYRFESYPVYVRVGRDFKIWKLRPFLFSSVGYNIKNGVDSNFIFSSPLIRIASFGQNIYHYEGGIFGDFGAGLAFRIKGKERLMISSTISQKRVVQRYSTQSWLAPGVTKPVTSRDIYVMNRYTVRLGWKFSWK